MKYTIDSLCVGMKVKPEELDQIKHTWMLVELNRLGEKRGVLTYFGGEADADDGMNTRFEIARKIYHTDNEKWGLYYYPPDEKQVGNLLASMPLPPERDEMTVDTLFGEIAITRAGKI